MVAFQVGILFDIEAADAPSAAKQMSDLLAEHGVRRLTFAVAANDGELVGYFDGHGEVAEVD